MAQQCTDTASSILRPSRRTFMVGSAALLAASGLPEIAQAAPKEGGVGKFALVGGQTGDSLDPATHLEIERFVANWTLRNNLTEISVDNEVIPELADSWEPSENLTTWTFKLRKGIEFHSGKTLTAADVVASINHHRGPDSKSTGRSVVEDVADVKADGDSVVVFKLTRAFAEFPALISDFHLSIEPVDKFGKLDVLSGDGTGPFILESYDPGVKTVAKKNPNYWKQGRGHFEQVELLCINDTNARQNALRSGAINVMNRCDARTAALLARVSDIEIIELPSKKHFDTPMRVNSPEFSDVNVRLAVKHAVNRKAIVDTALSGHGFVGNDHPLCPSYPFFAADIPQREYDIDKAKFYLKKAGHSSIKLQFYTSNLAFPTAVDTAVLMKEHAQPAGIDIEVVQEPADNYWASVLHKVPWCQSNQNGRATESYLFSHAYRSGAISNYAEWKNERFDKLLDEVTATLDPGKKRDIYREMQLLIRDDGGVGIFVFTTAMDAISKTIQHGKLSTSGFELDGCRAVERWWHA
jgi:peptide/nickel transport system substrate-binding protein